MPWKTFVQDPLHRGPSDLVAEVRELFTVEIRVYPHWGFRRYRVIFVTTSCDPRHVDVIGRPPPAAGRLPSYGAAGPINLTGTSGRMAVCAGRAI